MKYTFVIVCVVLSIIFLCDLSSRAGQVQTLDLKPGWNLVTITGRLTDNGLKKFLDLKPFELAEKKSYARCGTTGDVMVGCGYWIFSRTAKQLELEQDSTVQKSLLPEIVHGWNCLGFTENSKWQNDVSDIQKWQDGHFMRVEAKDLKRGNAYWGYDPRTRYKLTCSLSPATAKWMIGNKEYVSDETVKLPEGHYTIFFSEIEKYETPDPLEIDLTDDTDLTATYRKMYTLSYTLTPPTGQWMVNNMWLASGASIDLPGDRYWVSFVKPAEGEYEDADKQEVNLNADKNLTFEFKQKTYPLTYTLEPPTARWMVNGETYDSGQTAALPRGEYTVSFLDAPGYETPEPETISVPEKTNRGMKYKQKTHRLSFLLVPMTAKWFVNGNGYDSGANAYLPEDTYSVTFSEVEEYETPAQQTVTLTTDTDVRVEYERKKYSLSVTLTPENARWMVNGDWHASGERISLPAGTYDVTFEKVAGYETPDKRTVTLPGENSLTINYEQTKHALTYTLSPALGTWTVNGQEHPSGATIELVEGTYTVAFSAVPGYETPAPQEVQLTENKNLVLDYQELSPDTYLVIDLSWGPKAYFYPVRITNIGPNLLEDTCRTTELWLRKIPAGAFTMGSSKDELGRNSDEIQHQVTISEDFYIGVFEITQQQWELVMGNRPSYFNNEMCYASRPVECVSYEDIRGTGAKAGAGWPVYGHATDEKSFLGKLRSRTGYSGFDLPTEAQWEYACRAETATALNSGKNLTATDKCPEMDEVGRYWSNGGSRYSSSSLTDAGTAKAGSYKPNAWGLYDMHGNVLEWCLDWYSSYSTDEVTDPVGALSGTDRSIRGGAWSTLGNAKHCRSASRSYKNPSTRNECLGFRIAY